MTMKNPDNVMTFGNPVVAELNRVPHYNPLKYLRMTDKGPYLALKHKKLWFRLKYPQGRIRLSNLRITDQLAIIEARVYFDRRDTECVSSFTASCPAESAPDGGHILQAQEMAVDRALSDAGFGIQFDAGEVTGVPVAPSPAQSPVVVPPVPTKAVTKSEALVEKPAVTVVTSPAEKAEVAPQSPVQQAPPVAVVPPVTAKPAVKQAPPTVVKAAEPVAPVEAAITVIEEMLDDPEETAPAVSVAESPAAAPAYTTSTPVEEICKVMTLEEAENYVVTTGTCVGQKLSLVMERRPASLRYYINGYKGDDNILKAAATLLVQAHPELAGGNAA